MNQVIQFIVNNQVVIVGLFIAVLDFVFAMSPGLKSNGILHSLYMLLVKKNDSAPSAPQV